MGGVGGRSIGTQSGFREVSDPSVNAGFGEVNLGRDRLVIEPLELGQRGINQRECMHMFELRGFWLTEKLTVSSSSFDAKTEVTEPHIRSVEFRDCVSRISVFLVWPSR